MLCWLVLTQPTIHMLCVGPPDFRHVPPSKQVVRSKAQKQSQLPPNIPQQSFWSTGNEGSATEQTKAVLIRLLFLESVLRLFSHCYFAPLCGMPVPRDPHLTLSPPSLLFQGIFYCQTKGGKNTYLNVATR